MSLVERISLRLLRRMEPERAHALALRGLRAGLGTRSGLITTDRLRVRLAGLDLPNPLGLAAGFDKDGVAIDALLASGFGFVEVGATTPRPQPGNPRPRVFRLRRDAAVINRLGFNNGGMEVMTARLAERPRTGIVGLNVGANRDSADRAADYAEVLAHAGPFVDFATINVSSPNTERLRDLQGPGALAALIAGAREANDRLARPLPLFLKIAPDLQDGDLAAIAEVALAGGVAGIVATNTTTARDGLQGRHRTEAGGLSGQPLFGPSTRVLARLYRLTEGRMPLVGVGGVATAEQAYGKILAGASAVQLYTALVYGGFAIVPEILRGLDTLLARDGFGDVRQAVGTGADAVLSAA